MEFTIEELKLIFLALNNNRNNVEIKDLDFVRYSRCIEKINTEIKSKQEVKSPLEAHFEMISKKGIGCNQINPNFDFSETIGLAAEIHKLNKEAKRLTDFNRQLEQFNDTLKDDNKKQEERIEKLSADNLKLATSSNYRAEVEEEYKEMITELKAVVNKKNAQIEKLIDRL